MVRIYVNHTCRFIQIIVIKENMFLISLAQIKPTHMFFGHLITTININKKKQYF